MDGWYECFDLCNKWQFRMRHETECCSQTRRGSRQAVEADVLTRVLSCLLITPFHIDNFSSFFFHFSWYLFLPHFRLELHLLLVTYTHIYVYVPSPLFRDLHRYFNIDRYRKSKCTIFHHPKVEHFKMKKGKLSNQTHPHRRPIKLFRD
jgi:hypothetical protein